MKKPVPPVIFEPPIQLPEEPNRKEKAKIVRCARIAKQKEKLMQQHNRTVAQKEKKDKEQLTPGSLTALARTYSKKAIKTVEKIMKNRNTKPKDRLFAATIILDRAYGKPIVSIDVSKDLKDSDLEIEAMGVLERRKNEMLLAAKKEQKPKNLPEPEIQFPSKPELITPKGPEFLVPNKGIKYEK